METGTMKKFCLTLVLFFSVTLCISHTFAQYNPFIQKGLPEGAIARLGKGYIRGITYSSDSTQMAVSTYNGIWIYDASTGEELYLLTGQYREPYISAAYSLDGKTIATASGDGTMHWWDAHTGEKRKTFKGHTPHSLKYSPDGKTLLIVIGKEVQLRDAATDEYLHTLKGNSYDIEQAVFSPKGDIIAISTVVGTLGLWDASTGETIKLLIRDVGSENFDPRANRLPVFSPDGKMIAIIHGKETVWIWNTNSGEHITTLSGHESPLKLPVFSPNGRTI